MLRTESVPEGATFREIFEGRGNVTRDQVLRQIRRNVRRPLPQVDYFQPNAYKVALLCGGPSLAQAKVPRGYKVATVNGTYGWALEHGLKPSVYVQLDAREFNARFIDTVLPDCAYLLHSQVHPGIFDRLEKCRVYIWHGTSKDGAEKRLLDRYYAGRWRNVPGGSTAGTRAIWLLYMLGMRRIRVWGLDACYRRGAHHAYPQAENDGETVITVRVGGRRFRASTWMVAQLDEFLQMAPHFPDDLRLSFEGDGLIQHVVREAARIGGAPRIKMEKG